MVTAITSFNPTTSSSTNTFLLVFIEFHTWWSLSFNWILSWKVEKLPTFGAVIIGYQFVRHFLLLGINLVRALNI
jgi:hypothetical protein